MKLLVTGGTGFLGTHLVPKLLEAGHEVRLIGRTQPPAPALARAEFVQGDLKDREAVRRALEGVEAVYHLAGLVSFQDKDARRMYELHVDATRELLRDVREAGVKRVHPGLHLGHDRRVQGGAGRHGGGRLPHHGGGQVAVLPVEDLRGEADAGVLPEELHSAGGAQPEPADGAGG